MTESSLSQIFRPDLLSGQVCVVSGAGTGIGRAITLELTALGAIVAGCGRRAEPLEQTAQLCAGRPGTFEHEQLDIREDAEVERFVEGVIGRHGRIDALVNNAGGQFLAPAEQVTAKGFRTVVELNLVGTWLMTHAVATRSFIPRGAGKVISITLSPHNGMPGMVHSGAARAGVENMMRTLSIEWAAHGVTTCAIAPGQIATDVLREKYPKAVVDNVARTIPAGRLGEPEDIAWLVALLASPAGRFVSGSVITVDGARDNHFGPWPPPQMSGEGEEREEMVEQRRPGSGEERRQGPAEERRPGG